MSVRSFYALLFLVLSATSLLGQTVSTQILGLITDSSGGIIAGATITARRPATGDSRITKSNDTGNYIFPLLDIGEYEITVAAAGFKTELRSGIQLQLQQKARLDFIMQVGQQAETVEVSGRLAILRTEDATLGSVIEEKRIVELPLNGRNFAQLATLMPGVQFGASRMGLNGQGTIASVLAMPGQIAGISANGQRDANQNITVDGVVAVDSHHSAMLFSPSIEALEEFKIQSAVYSAEFGMNSGAQANLAIKSGTNSFHGTAFEFLRNDSLDARGYFLSPTATKNKLRRNSYGGVFSGPVVIPKLYNGKDKTFFLVNYEGRRERRGTPGLGAAATEEMRRGDFSELLTPRNRWYPNDTTPRLIGAPGDTVPFPNNQIPANLINPVSNNLLTYKNTSPFSYGGFVPLPNQDAAARQLRSTLNLSGLNNQILDSDQYMGRADHRFGDNDRIFAHYIIVDSTFVDDPVTRASRTSTGYRAQHFAVGYTKILSPRWLNEARFGMNRMRVQQGGLQTGTDFTQRDLGLDFRVALDNNRQLSAFEEGLPSIGIDGYVGPNSGNVQYNKKIVWEWSDNMTFTSGKHNYKFGGLYRYNMADGAGGNTPRGSLSFTRDIANVPDAFAAFLLGVPLSANSAEGAPPTFIRQSKFGLYALDDYKVTNRLTLNLGVRWDWFGNVTDAQGRIRNVSFETQNIRNIGGVIAPTLIPNPGVSQKLYDINWKQVMPRIGIAYRIGNSTVLRMGAGNFFNAQQTNNFSILSLNPPFSGSFVFQNDRTRPTATIQNPFAGAPVTGTPVALVMLGYLQENGRSNYKNNHIWQWSTEIEKSLGKDWVGAAGYVGSAGSNIENTVPNWNNPDPGPGAVQARRPFPFYVDSRDTNTLLPFGTIRRLESWASSNYHALQSRIEKRYSKGLTLNGSFTYQKAMAVAYGANEGAGFGQNQVQNPRNRLADYGRSNIDQRLRFVWSSIYEIPWMRDKKGMKGWMLGGWSVNGIVVLQSGLPVTINQNGDSQNTGAASAPRPYVVAGAVAQRVWDHRSVSKWFDTSAYVRSKFEGSTGEGLFLPGTLGYGNVGTGTLEAPATKTIDFALFKEFRIREGHKIQFRWEAFNFLNTPQFNAPDRTLGSPTFGQITSTVVNNREMQFGLKYRF